MHIIIHSNTLKKTHWWTVNARNSQTILTSETYITKSGAKRAATRFAEKFDIEIK